MPDELLSEVSPIFLFLSPLSWAISTFKVKKNAYKLLHYDKMLAVSCVCLEGRREAYNVKLEMKVSDILL